MFKTLKKAHIFSVFLLIYVTAFPATSNAAVTIDGDFTDWEYQDIKAMDLHFGMSLGTNPSYEACYPIGGDEGEEIVPPGSDAVYLFDDGYDDSRDLVAFYFSKDEDNVYFRIDFFDLKYMAEASGCVDCYVMIDCDSSAGETWLPDYTDCQTDMPWDIAFCIYDTVNWSVKEGAAGQPEIPADLIGPAFHSELDSVEFGASRQLLMDHGWNGTGPLKFQVFTTKDGTNEGAGEIGGTGGGPGNSDITDAFIDDDRGFGDGYLNGWFSSLDEAPGRAKWVVLMHGNQSFNNEMDIQARLDKSKDTEMPMLGVGLYRALETAEITGMPVELHLSGTLSLGAQWADPSFNERIKAGIENGLVRLTGGVFAEHMMPFFRGEVNQRSIFLGTELINTIYEVPPSDLPVFWIPERTARGDFTDDILAANDRFGYNYEAVVLDEFTHHHRWFAYKHCFNEVYGDEELVDLDDDVHKIHEYQGMKIFFIDRYAQKWKTETMYPTFYDCSYEPSLQIGLRAKLLEKVFDPDQEQVILCMEDWEDYAGEPYRAQPSPRNPDGHEIVTRWIANHQWILMTTLTDILKGNVDIDGDGAGDQWNTVYDPPLTDYLPDDYGLPLPPYWLEDTLPIVSYAWLQDSADGGSAPADQPESDPRDDKWDDGYQNWYWGSPWEWSFKDTVPALKGWQYDADEEGAYPEIPLPNGKTFNGMWQWNDGQETAWNTGIIPETWNRLNTSDGDERLLMLAEYAFMAMLYEAAWHDEYTVRDLTGDEDDDDAKGVLVEWVLPACNHIRDVNMIVEAAEWAASNRTAVTSAEERDVDLDGENEYLLYNDKLFLIFENDGGRLVKAYMIDKNGLAIEVIGASVNHPDLGSEDEAVDEYISIDPDPVLNRVSGFRDEKYVNDEYLVSLKPGSILFYSSDLSVRREISLPDGSYEITAEYELNGIADMNVEFGFAPNTLENMFNGKENLENIGLQSGDFYGIRNVSGGAVFVRFDDADFVFADDMDRDHTCALTQRVVVNVEDNDVFRIGFGGGWTHEKPVVEFVTIEQNPLESGNYGYLNVQAWIAGDEISRVDLLYGGTQLNPMVAPMPILQLKDDGTQGDFQADDGIYTFRADLPPGTPPSNYILGVQAFNARGDESEIWPFLNVGSSDGYGASDNFLPFLHANADYSAGAYDFYSASSYGQAPVIPIGAYYETTVTEENGGHIALYVLVEDQDSILDVETVELLVGGVETGMEFDHLGENIFGLELDVGPGVPRGYYMLEVRATDYSGLHSNIWPYWQVR